MFIKLLHIDPRSIREKSISLPRRADINGQISREPISLLFNTDYRITRRYWFLTESRDNIPHHNGKQNKKKIICLITNTFVDNSYPKEKIKGRNQGWRNYTNKIQHKIERKLFIFKHFHFNKSIYIHRKKIPGIIQNIFTSKKERKGMEKVLNEI